MILEFLSFILKLLLISNTESNRKTESYVFFGYQECRKEYRLSMYERDYFSNQQRNREFKV